MNLDEVYLNRTYIIEWTSINSQQNHTLYDEKENGRGQRTLGRAATRGIVVISLNPVLNDQGHPFKMIYSLNVMLTVETNTPT